MKASIIVTFLSLFADTVKTHGLKFAYAYYVKRHRMAQWEFRFWCRQVWGV